MREPGICESHSRLIFKGMWAVCDGMWLHEPYIFQDQDKGTQTAAVYASYDKAREVADHLTEISKNRRYVVRRW